MQRLDWPALSEAEKAQALERPAMDRQILRSRVAAIIQRVRAEGDAALRALTLELDGCAPESLAVDDDTITAAHSRVSAGLKSAIAEAMQRIEAFHAASMTGSTVLETAPGLLCESRLLPLQSVGLYVPGGSAPLISTVLMLALPARLAACPEVVLCTPPDKQGEVHPAILYAASQCGVKQVFRVGGAQAIAAMAYGTERILRCRKIFGPGNAWVAEAKQQVAADPAGAAQDLPAGPSEVMVIADRLAEPEAVCWDLLSQAEHGPDSQAILLSDSTVLLDEVERILPALKDALPRADVLAQSLAHMRLVRVDDLGEAVSVSNRYAPEHLILNCSAANALADRIISAGSVFIGRWTPEALGDYCSGTNHVLPTNGYAHACSGLAVVDFQRRMSLQTASLEGLRNAGPAAMTLAAAEGMEAHRQAIQYRISAMEPG